MKLHILFLLFILLFSCSSPNNSTWHTLDFGVFKIKAPHDWESYKLKGIDSYVGGLTNGKDSLEFDYGWYSAEVGDEDTSKHLFAQDTINGLLAFVVIPKMDKDGCVRMSMRVSEKDKFSIGGCNFSNTDTILRILKSIIFSVSDTSKNGSLIRAKFKEGSHGSGRTIYMINCASCHSFTKNLTGPALITAIERRDEKWIKTFLLDKKAILNDTSYLNSRNKYNGMICPDYFNLSETDIDMLLSYFSTYSSRK
jgi:Cytochrome c